MFQLISSLSLVATLALAATPLADSEAFYGPVPLRAIPFQNECVLFSTMTSIVP